MVNSEFILHKEWEFLGYKIFCYDSVSSTNELAKKMMRKYSNKFVILANTQKNGKGRLKRSWISPRGGLWISIVLRPQLGAKVALKLTFIASLSVAITIRDMYKLKADVKWPNDVTIKNRKLCGILTEGKISGQKLLFAILGIGINANIELDAFPPEIRESTTTLQNELGRKVRRRALTKCLLQNFEEKYLQLLQNRWEDLLNEWKSLASFLGKDVTIRRVKDTFSAKAIDVDAEGALLIKDKKGQLQRIFFDDVIL